MADEKTEEEMTEESEPSETAPDAEDSAGDEVTDSAEESAGSAAPIATKKRVTGTREPKMAKKSGGANIPHVGGEGVVIAARHLSLWYGQVIGINDINIDLGTGVIGLLGPNGAGKSTFMKVMTGQLQPSTGTASVLGKVIRSSPEVMSEIGFVPEQDAFYEEMTGREFVTYLTRLQGFEKEKARELADIAIETVDLTEKRDIPIGEYSKGMRQRIKIAQALAHNPRVLFLDEPLAGTDPVGRRAIIELIRKLGSEGRTVVVSSHILHEVEQMTRNILLINKGRVVADGDLYKIREMIDQHPHTILLAVDRPREFAKLLAQYEDVVGLEFVKLGLQVRTRDPDSCYTRIPELALEHDFRLRSMSSPDNNLTAVFDYLVN